jgi:hypothetical protein
MPPQMIERPISDINLGFISRPIEVDVKGVRIGFRLGRYEQHPSEDSTAEWRLYSDPPGWSVTLGHDAVIRVLIEPPTVRPQPTAGASHVRGPSSWVTPPSRG